MYGVFFLLGGKGPALPQLQCSPRGGGHGAPLGAARYAAVLQRVRVREARDCSSGRLCLSARGSVRLCLSARGRSTHFGNSEKLSGVPEFEILGRMFFLCFERRFHRFASDFIESMRFRKFNFF